MNAYKSFSNGRTLYGPMMRMRGITNSQINTGLAFIVYMTFKVMVTRNNRVLEEDEKVPAICEVLDSVDESPDDFNIVEYDCIANYTGEKNLSESSLGKIEEDEDSSVLGKTNLDEVINETDVSTLVEKKRPNYTVSNYVSTVTFEINEVKNITSDNYYFNVSIPGKLNKESNAETIDVKMKFFEINDEANCTFEIKEDNISAQLNCEVDLKEHKDVNSVSFKTFEIGDKSKPVYLSKINEISLVNEIEPEDTTYADFIRNLKKIGIIVAIIIVLLIILSIVIYFILKTVKKAKQAKNNLKENPVAIVNANEKCLTPAKVNIGYVNPSSVRKL